MRFVDANENTAGFTVRFHADMGPARGRGTRAGRHLRRHLCRLAVALPLALALAVPARAGEGCSSGKPCTECHQLTVKEAKGILGRVVDDVLEVRAARIPGLWAIDVKKRGQKVPIYLDFSKKYLVTGDVLDLGTLTNLTRDRYISLNRIDPSIIPLDDAVVVGDPAAEVRIVVFDDPECPFCKKLHPEMKKVVSQRPDVAFFIKMLPLKIHPNARKKAEAIICAKSAQLLEDSLAGKEIPDPTCETDQVEKNEALARKIGVRSTPTLVFPDGRVVPGYKNAARILRFLEEDKKERGKAVKR